MNKIFLLSTLFLLSSCGREVLHVEKQWMTPDRYASVFVDTPDPKKYFPSVGERLLIQWRLTPEEFRAAPTMQLRLYFKNYESATQTYQLPQARGRIAFLVMDDDYFETGGIAAYDVEICGVARVKHSLWKELIILD